MKYDFNRLRVMGCDVISIHGLMDQDHQVLMESEDSNESESLNFGDLCHEDLRKRIFLTRDHKISERGLDGVEAMILLTSNDPKVCEFISIFTT